MKRNYIKIDLAAFRQGVEELTVTWSQPSDWSKRIFEQEDKKCTDIINTVLDKLAPLKPTKIAP